MSAFSALALVAALAPGSEVVRDWLVVEPTDKTGRRPFAPSAVIARHLATRDAAPPKVGDALAGENGEERKWTEQRAGDDGSLGGRIGWAYARVDSAKKRVVLAKLTGAGRLFVNGAGFPGDLYAYGFGGVPVELTEGANHVYVGGVRGSFRLELFDVATPVVAGSWDHLVPDRVRGDEGSIPSIGVLAFNATDATREVTIRGVEGVAATTEDTYVDSMTLPPGAAWRFSIPIETKYVPAEATSALVRVALEADGRAVEERVDVPVRGPDEARRVGFTSRIDGSLQAYSLLPPKDRAPRAEPFVLLSLHGASVDALGQARSYAQKERIAVVCPTNRRPYGFDWQDWGRIDAYEALDHHLEATRPPRADHGAAPSPDPRTYAEMRRASAHLVLTGHSMGGHGTWSLAANDADLFDAIGPSAGWASFDSYGGRPDGALKHVWRGADLASQTEDLAANLVRPPIFVLHGTADDNVPDSEARAMIARLEALGAKPKSHFQEGAGHWWDGDLSAGADCVDHPGILALFDELPGEERAVDPYAFDWIGADPGIDSEHRFVEVLQPLAYGRPFRVASRRGVEPGTLAIETENVRAIRFGAISPRFRVALDGRDVGGAARTTWTLTAEGWTLSSAAIPRGKNPDLCGPFKRAFDERFVLVYGTSGDDAEDRELLERARHDQLAWWYRANATPRIVTDAQFVAEGFRGRNVILYGNRDSNSAWKRVVAEDAPFDARRGEMRVGKRAWKGDDLGMVVVYPRADDPTGLVGAFADSGVRGARLGYALAPFVSGVGYPDYALYSGATLAKGDGGVLAAGWFDAQWRYDEKQYVAPD